MSKFLTSLEPNIRSPPKIFAWKCRSESWYKRDALCCGSALELRSNPPTNISVMSSLFNSNTQVIVNDDLERLARTVVDALRGVLSIDPVVVDELRAIAASQPVVCSPSRDRALRVRRGRKTVNPCGTCSRVKLKVSICQVPFISANSLLSSSVRGCPKGPTFV